MSPRMRNAAALCIAAPVALACALAAKASDRTTELPTQVQQGAMVVGRTMAANQVNVGGRPLRVADDGTFVFGIGRDQSEPMQVEITWFDGVRESVRVQVTPRDWPVEQIDGVPPKTVNPPPAIA